MKHDVHHGAHAERPLACADARLAASAWLDGEEPASAKLTRHLESCADCRAHLDDLRALAERLDALRDGPWDVSAARAPASTGAPGPDLWPGIAARASAAGRARRAWRPVALRAAAALIGCAGTAAMLQVLARGESLSSSVPPSVSQTGLPAWDAPLRADRDGPVALRGSLEQHLVAALERTRRGAGAAPAEKQQ